MRDIFSGMAERNNVLQQLYQLKLLTKDEVRVIKSTRYLDQSIVIVKIVANRILTGDMDDFTRLAKFMKSNLILKYLFQYWNNTSNIFVLTC